MDGSESRQIARDSLFVLADMRMESVEGDHRIKVRNLSPGGMMGEGTVRVSRGDKVTVNIRNNGWTEGVIAWVQDNRFGVAFQDEIDAKAARLTTAPEPSKSFIAPPPRPRARSAGVVRKV